MKNYLFTVMMLLTTMSLQAQSFCGVHKYDGEHKNEGAGYVISGYNVVSGAFVGVELSYKRHLTDRWHVSSNGQLQFGKQIYSIGIEGGYRLPWGFSDFYFEGRAIANRYNRWQTNEKIYNLSVAWETPYIHLRLGESYIHYQFHDDGYSEPLTMTFGTGVTIRPRWHPWNIGLFFRNYDEFYYENWNINWGLQFYAQLRQQMMLFGEFTVRPAGSISQLASKYETTGRLGIKYVW